MIKVNRATTQIITTEVTTSAFVETDHLNIPISTFKMEACKDLKINCVRASDGTLSRGYATEMCDLILNYAAWEFAEELYRKLSKFYNKKC